MRIKEVISLVILLTVIEAKTDPFKNKIKVLRGTDNDMKEGVCKVSCEKVNKMIERIDAMDKKLDKLLAKDCKACSTSPCLNNGVCTDLVNGYNCTCPAGFSGSRCEKDINECSSSPCLNNGVCTDLVNGYNCTCPAGFNGSRCEKDINECASSPCLNNGVCKDLVNGYNCTCPAGFNGSSCENDINECSSSPCLNNGVCIDLVNGYNCTCPAGFQGSRCEKGSSFKMESTILSANKSYERELQKLLAPAVGDKQNWKLCYRRSRDDNLSGNTKAFHSNCDGKRNTVIIAQVGDFVFGGYTDVAWALPPPNRGSNYGATHNAFVFSLRNKQGLRPFKCMVWVPQFAILSTSQHNGPHFGGVDDLDLLSYWQKYQTGKSSRSKLGQYYRLPNNVQNAIGSRYMYLAGTYRFEPDEVEAFYLG